MTRRYYLRIKEFFDGKYVKIGKMKNLCDVISVWHLFTNLVDRRIVDRLHKFGPAKEAAPPMPGRSNLGAKTCFWKHQKQKFKMTFFEAKV